MYRDGGHYRWLPCGRARTCPYCARLEAQELARVITLDAADDPPLAVMLLSTRNPAHHAAAFRLAMKQTVKALRRRWAAFQYQAFIEFTTGDAPSSRGARLMHAHVLVKGVSADELEAVQTVARSVWADRLGADLVTCKPIENLPGLIRYLTEPKQSQTPPPWWKGMRRRPSRGYYRRPIAELQAQAKTQLAHERRVWTARERLGPNAPGAAVEAEAAREAAWAAEHPWRVVRVRESASGVVTPLAPVGTPEVSDRRPLMRAADDPGLPALLGGRPGADRERPDRAAPPRAVIAWLSRAVARRSAARAPPSPSRPRHHRPALPSPPAPRELWQQWQAPYARA